MPHLIIDDQSIEIANGRTILDACKLLGIEIPTLCLLKDYSSYTSCMICMVKEKKSNKLLPSCTALAEEGMLIETDNSEIREFRKEALELLLSEHTGSCEGPCEWSCPVHINIPLMIRLILAGKYSEAIRIIKKELPFPAIFGRICPAPCEKGCRRRYFDSAISIRLLIRYIADKDLALDAPYIPYCIKKTGKKVAIIGSGPAELSAAYYLLQEGHSCIIFDKKEKPGGILRDPILNKILPPSILDREINMLQVLGAEFRIVNIDQTDSFFSKLYNELQENFHAICFSTDTVASINRQNVKDYPPIFRIDDNVSRKVNEKVKTGHRMQIGMLGMLGMPAIKRVATGKSVSHKINSFLKGNENTGAFKKQFSSKTWRMQDNEGNEIDTSKGSDDRQEGIQLKGVQDKVVHDKDFSLIEAEVESRRCLQCDCTARDSCKLRDCATEYGAKQYHYKSIEGIKSPPISRHAVFIHDPGKCIKCGICVRITEKANEKYGFTFIGKGLDMKIDIPFHQYIAGTNNPVFKNCVKMCPTGALAFRKEDVT